MHTLRLGTRGSLLARTQSQIVADAIEAANPRTRVELVILKTTGDVVQDKPLHDIGGKGLFTKELELALLRGDIDLAVHSYKDVPVTMPLVDTGELFIAAVPARNDARDVLITNAHAMSIDQLPQHAVVGTGSLRRQAHLSNVRPDVTFVALRGNIDTRLKKLRAGDYDAIVLAAAGLLRAGLFDSETMTMLPVELMVPSAGQGALALQTRRDATDVIDRLLALHCPNTAACVDTEREVVRLLDGDCKSPIGASAVLHERIATLHASTIINTRLKMSAATINQEDVDTLPGVVVGELKAL